MPEFKVGNYSITVDDIDADLMELSWRVYFGRWDYPQITRKVNLNGKWSTTTLARTILERIIERPLLRRELADHADTDPFNNHRENLRVATPLQNTVNSRRRSDNKTGFKGVCATGYKDPLRQYVAQCAGEYLGYFPTAEEAHAAYCKAAVERWGEFANFGERHHA